MSKIPHASLSSKDDIDRLRQLKWGLGEMKSKVKSSVVPAPPPTPREAQKTKKILLVDVDEDAIKDRNICLSFPSTAHAYSEFAPHFKESKKLFPLNRAMFDQIGSPTVGEIGIANLFKVYLCFSFMFVMFVFAVSTILLTFIYLFCQGIQSLLYLNEKASEFDSEINWLKFLQAELHS